MYQIDILQRYDNIENIEIDLRVEKIGNKF